MTTALLAVIALVLLPAISNVEANELPPSWAPLLWIAWPAGLLLAAPLVYMEIRQRHQGHGLGPDHGAASAAGRQRRDRAVSDLAVAVMRQWTDEMGRWSVRRATPLRVRWSTTSRPVASTLAGVVSQEVPHRPKAVRGDTAAHLFTLLGSMGHRQLVILGEPGAGKTVLAVLFALQVLERRQAGDPVPVVLGLSSWNPAVEDLHTWLARRIVEEYPAVGNKQVYGVDAARSLVADGRVLAVLDGLDEMPASARLAAIATLDHVAGTGYPMVVTCRSQEYEDVVTGGGAFLSRAAVAEIEPVDLADAGRYLIDATPRGSGHWQPVLDELAARPDAPLARTLTSPLMISLARAVYAAPAS
ncbi:MAG TPA: NACHT domain-containing protein, partial [Pseudonocardiaceae bacterium]|nr:NACHT domain-containing protein [Pseudonocardiaceae bacterium]